MREPISQEDPQAIEKIIAKITDLKRDQETMKARNKAWKKDGAEGLIALGMNRDAAARIAQIIEGYTYQDKQPHARYEITNNGSNIRRLEKRLEELTRKAVTPLREPITGNGWSLEEDADINRTCLRFDVSRVPEEIYHRLKSHGFRKTQENVWQRHRNDDAWYWAEVIGKAYASIPTTADAIAKKNGQYTADDLSPTTRVRTPYGDGVVAFVRMAGPSYTHVDVVSVVLDSRLDDPKYTGTIVPAHDVEIIK